jgi:hypothetical protein
MVPLWLALHLRMQDKCKITAPDWMNVESLKAVLQKEKEDLGRFEVLPFHYVEIAEQLLTVYECVLSGRLIIITPLVSFVVGLRATLPIACACARC